FSTLTGIINSLFGMWWVFVIALLMLAFHYRLTAREKSTHGLPPLPVILLLVAAGLPFIVGLPKASEVFYEPRQLLPFAAIVMGVLGWRLVLSVVRMIRRDFPAGSLSGKWGSVALSLLFALPVFGFVSSGASFPPAAYLRTIHAAYGKEISLAGEL